MMAKITIAALVVSAAAALGGTPALAGGDPVATLQGDLSSLQGTVATAHDTLLADLGKVTTDAGNLQSTTDRAAVRAALRGDLQTFRVDRRSAFRSIHAARLQVRADVKAARAANVDPSTIRPLLRDAALKDRAAVQEVRQAAREARRAVRELLGSLRNP
jgi:hypothetical protein